MSNLEKAKMLKEIIRLMESIVAFFWECGIKEYPDILKIGGILLKDVGKNIVAELFLLSFLIDDPKDSQSFLSVVVSHLKGRDRDALINELRESCYAFLSVYLEEMQEYTKEILQNIEKNPPTDTFLLNANNKIAGLKKSL